MLISYTLLVAWPEFVDGIKFIWNLELIKIYFAPVDDARILLGVHYHGYGSWEKIRNDPRLGLHHKIAPLGCPAGETYLPRAPNLDARVNALLRKVSWFVQTASLEFKKYMQ